MKDVAYYKALYKRARIQTDCATDLQTLNVALSGISASNTALRLEIINLNGQITTLKGEKDTLQGSLNTANSQITTLNGQINALTSKLDAANALNEGNAKKVQVYKERLEKAVLDFLAQSQTIKYDENNKRFTIELGAPSDIDFSTWMPGQDDYILINKSGDYYKINWQYNTNFLKIHKVDATTSRNEVGGIILKYGKMTHKFNFKTLIIDSLLIEDFYLNVLGNSTWNVSATKDGDEMNEFFKFLNLFRK